jgi:hypothetical protein
VARAALLVPMARPILVAAVVVQQQAQPAALVAPVYSLFVTQRQVQHEPFCAN